MKVEAIKTRIMNAKENLESFIIEHIPVLEEKSVLVISSKIVALSQGLLLRFDTASKFDEYVQKVSEKSWKTPLVWTTVRNGIFMPNAGIDNSNIVEGQMIDTPHKPFEVAQTIQGFLREHFKINHCGVIITDSTLIPGRAGVIGVALGYAGFKGCKDYRGENDLYGNQLTMTQTNFADGIATSATLTMGEGDESTPLAIATDTPVIFDNGNTDISEILIGVDEDYIGSILKK